MNICVKQFLRVAFCAAFFLLFMSHGFFGVAHATDPLPLNFVSDTISDSRNNFPANHTVVFQVPGGVPAGGTIVVAFENDAFLIDPSFSYQDVDFAVSTSSPYSGFVERDIATAPDATDDGVAVTPETGPITTTLSPAGGIPAGAYVRFMFGTNAPQGTYQITNPVSTASYRIPINTYDASHVSINYGAAMVAILPGGPSCRIRTR